MKSDTLQILLETEPLHKASHSSKTILDKKHKHLYTALSTHAKKKHLTWNVPEVKMPQTHQELKVHQNITTPWKKF